MSCENTLENLKNNKALNLFEGFYIKNKLTTKTRAVTPFQILLFADIKLDFYQVISEVKAKIFAALLSHVHSETLFSWG